MEESFQNTGFEPRNPRLFKIMREERAVEGRYTTFQLHRSLIRQFKVFVNDFAIPERKIIDYLKQTNWDLELAVTVYLSDNDVEKIS